MIDQSLYLLIHGILASFLSDFNLHVPSRRRSIDASSATMCNPHHANTSAVSGAGCPDYAYAYGKLELARIFPD